MKSDCIPVLIEAQRLFRKKKHGIEVVALEMIKRLAASNNSFHFDVIVKTDEDVCLKENEKISIRPIAGGNFATWEQRLLPQFSNRRKNTLLHCTGNTAPLLVRNPLLLTIHDLIFLEENYLFKKGGLSLYQRFGNFYRRLIVPLAAKKAKHIITVSQFQKKNISRRLNIPEEKISVVYNGVDDRFFQKSTAAEKKGVMAKYKLQSPYIFYFANTEPRKNTIGVLNAFAHLCRNHPGLQHRLVMKGLSQVQLLQRLADCEAIDCFHQIDCIDYIDYADLPVLYQAADLFWFPSFTEGFGLPLLEAMASGVPVVTSDCSVMPEIVDDAAICINPHDPIQLAEQSVQVLTNAELRKALVAKGERRAAEFTWEKAVAELLHIYQQLAGAVNPAAPASTPQLLTPISQALPSN